MAGQQAQGLVVEQPPIDISIELSSYLTRMFISVDNSLKNAGKLPVNKLLPPKPVIGKLYYFENEIPETDITQEGLYIFKYSGWVFIA